MEKTNRFKELIEKIKAHAHTKNDEELKALVASFDTAADDEGPGGNSPEVPDIP